MLKIFIGSSVHRWDDSRIFLKEAISLSKRYTVELHAPAEFEYKEVNSIKIYGLPTWKNIKDRKNIRKILWRRIKNSDFDIFHFHDPELIFIGLYVQYIKRKKVIYDIHENISKQILIKYYIPTCALRKLYSITYSFIEKIVIRLFKGIVVAGKDILEGFNKKVILNNYPILFMNDNLYNKKENCLVYIGGVTNIRGVEETARALQKINAEQIENKIKLKIIGDFNNHNYKNYLLDKYKDVIMFLGWKKQKEVFELSKNCIAGVALYLPVPHHMSLRSNKVFEYMVAQLPVLYSNFPDWKVQLDDYNLGLAVDPMNEKDIISKIKLIIQKPDLAKEMGNNGFKLVLEKYNWINEEKKLFKLYNKLLNN